MEKLSVKDVLEGRVEQGQRAGGLYLVARKQQATGKNNKAFLKLTLQDKTGQLDARVWHDAETVGATFEQGDLVEVEGLVDSFQGKAQLTVDKLSKHGGEGIDRAEFEFAAPAEAPREKAAGCGEGMVGALRAELAKVSDPHVRTLLLGFMDDPEIAPRLRRAPAAKEIHHAYPGGLAEHMLSCVRLAQRLADHYPMVDRDLMVAGAFLHDLGKVNELSYDKGGTGYTDEGRLVGHLVMTAQWIHERAGQIPGFPKELELHLTHIVLAHHGRMEFGSPKLPHTLEAFLVHELDEIDSRVNSWLSQMARSPGDRWSEPSKGFERLLWKGATPTEEGRRKGAAWKQLRKGKGEKKRKEGAPAEGGAPAPQREPREPREPRERRERPQREERGAEARPGEARGAERPQREERPAREERGAEARGGGEARGGAEGERRGPKILKRAEGGRPAAGEPKLTFKPFSALGGPEEAEGVEGELAPVPVETAGQPVREEPEAATTETLPATGPEDLTTGEKLETT